MTEQATVLIKAVFDDQSWQVAISDLFTEFHDAIANTLSRKLPVKGLRASTEYDYDISDTVSTYAERFSTILGVEVDKNEIGDLSNGLGLETDEGFNMSFIATTEVTARARNIAGLLRAAGASRLKASVFWADGRITELNEI